MHFVITRFNISTKYSGKGMKSKMKSNKKYWKIIFFIMCIGAILRIGCCFWGHPYYQLHPDEGTIVNNAIDMLSRHSWEAYVYNRPDQFEIKCCSLIFQIGS